MKLSLIERQVLVAAQLAADCTAAELARKLRRKEHTVRRAITKLLDSGVFSRKASLNLSPIGLHEYNMYFSLNCESIEARDRLFTAIAAQPGVKWLLEMTGGYDALIGILAPSFRGVANILDTLSKNHGNFVFTKEFTSVISFTYYGRRYFDPHPSHTKSLTAEDYNSLITIDPTDKKILKALTCKNYSGIDVTAREIDIPPSTLRARMKKLQENGIIVGMTFNAEKIPAGVFGYRVLLYTRGFQHENFETLKGLANKDLGIVYLIRTIGNWDYELQYESLSATDIVSLGARIVRALGESLLNVKVLPIVQICKRTSFPFIDSRLENTL